MSAMSQRWISGVDEPLPDGETVLWSGRPDVRAVARHVMHVRLWGAYMAGLTLIVGVSAATSLSPGDALRVMLFPVLLAALLLAGIAYLARLTARTTQYVVTSRRLVLRVGVAFPIAINIPLRLVDGADLRMFRDGSGEIRLSLSPDVSLAYIALWPHVDSFRSLSHPRPKLRGLPDAASVGALLRAAMEREVVSPAASVAASVRDPAARAPARVPAVREAMAR